MKKLILKSISFSYLYILVYLITGLLTTPLLLREFGTEYFALLMLVYAVVVYLNHIRFGLPESLSVLIAKERSITQKYEWIKNTFLILVCIVVAVIALLFVLTIFVDDLGSMLGDVDNLDKNIVTMVLSVLVLFALIKIPFELSLSVFIGFNEVYLEKIYKILTIVVNFALVIFTVYTHLDIVSFSIYAGILDLLVSFVAFVHIFKRYNIIHKVGNLTSFHQTSSLFKNGMYFFQLTVTHSLIWGMGIFMVSHILILEQVAIYSLTMKIYIYLFFILTIVNTVLSPLYGKYISSCSIATTPPHDNKVSMIFDISCFAFPFVGGFIWIGTLLFMSDIMNLWTGSGEYFVGNIFVLFMGLFFYISGYVNTFLTFIFSIGKAKDIVLIRWSEVGLSGVLSSVFVYLFGLVGVVMGATIAILLVSMRSLTKYIKNNNFYGVDIDFTIHKKHFIFVLLPCVIISYFSVFVDLSLFWKISIFVAVGIFYISSSWLILIPYYKKTIVDFIKLNQKVET